MTTAIVCVALLGLLVIGLGLAVSLTRGSTQTNFGVTPDPTDRLYKLVRAHGNASEYAPMLALLILVLGLREPATWVSVTSAIAVASRYLHAFGMVAAPTLDAVFLPRAIGAVVTYLAGLVLVLALLLSL